MVEIKTDNYTETLKENKVVLIDFYADWCGPCRVMGPILDKINEDMKDCEGLAIGKCNVDEQTTVAQANKITSIPCLKFYKNGEFVEEMMGVIPDIEEVVKQKLEELLQD